MSIKVLEVWWCFSLKFITPWVLLQNLLAFDLVKGGQGLLSDLEIDQSDKLIRWELIKIAYFLPMVILILYFACANFDAKTFDLDFL